MLNTQFVLWGVSGLVLIALAGTYPNLAIFFMALLIIGVLVMNSSEYLSLVRSTNSKGKG